MGAALAASGNPLESIFGGKKTSAPVAPVLPPPPAAATPATQASAAATSVSANARGKAAAGAVSGKPSTGGGTVGGSGPQGLSAPPQTANLTLLGASQ